MKTFIFLATFLTLIYLAQALRTNLRLMVYNYQINVPIGKLTVILHGVNNIKEYTFNQNKFKYSSQEITGVTEFPDEDIEKVEVKWIAENEDNLKIGSFSTEVDLIFKTFMPENGYQAKINNGETINLIRSL